ncbi:DUF6049 family protein [Peterkaempfera bronchialis]|uniref:Uncharacterized protein n=1 Tax=Peterkaempfera bronchialis TaxID=2126346 RepID=A0A345SY06_9ACTN|nr:DUF6049 family protein [Peterkaempfera bronchialis]AXI78611.1 hypothetical protein C7M71_015420 [Peterkaempfera bronchialis]
MGEAARYAGGPGCGLRPGGAAGRYRRAAALAGACALALLGGFAVAPVAQAGPAQGAASAKVPAAGAVTAASAGKTRLPGASKPSTEYPVALSIDSVSPSYLSGGSSRITVSGTVTNGGRKAVHDAHLGLRTGSGSPLHRSDIAAVAQRTDPVSGDGQEVPGIGSPLADLAPGASRPFAVTAKASQLQLSTSGVYELAVDVKGSAGEDPTEVTLGIARTFLPYYPDPRETKKTQIATVWPVTHTPQLVPQNLPDTAQTPVLSSDDLATELARGGRLNELVAAGGSLSKVTWAVDGDLLDTAYAMSSDYRVQQDGTQGDSAGRSNTDPGSGSDQATAWLDLLRDAVKGDEVVALPYGDPDLASIAHNGSGIAGLKTALQRASSAGDVTTDFRLRTDARSDVAWPYQGHIDPQVVGTARTAGSTVVLVNGSDMPTPDSVWHTVNAVRPIGKGVKALVSDAVVSDIFAGDLRTPAARELAVQRFLAETLTITLEQPNQQRSILVMPPRNLSADAAATLAEAMAKATQGRWADQATLGTVAKAPVDPDANAKIPSTAKYPKAARAGQLSRQALAGAMGIQGKLDVLMQILTQPEHVREPFNAAILRSMSTAWRTDRPGGRLYRDGVQGYLESLSSAVRLVEKRSTTLSGDSGVIQVSVENGLSQPIENLEVRLYAGSPTRLTVYRPTPERLAIGGELKKSIRFPAKASVNGTVRMTAQLWTTGDNPRSYGSPVTFDLQVTDVTNGVIWVIVGGMLLVLLAGVRFYFQRKKRSADDPDPDPEAEVSPEGDPEGTTARPGTVDEGNPPQEGPAGGVEGPDRTARDEKVGP